MTPSQTQAEIERKSAVLYLHERDRANICLRNDTLGGSTLKEEFAFHGCPFCQGKEYEEAYYSALGSHSAAPYTYVRCKPCAVVYPWPRLTREALQERVNQSWMNRFLAKSFAHVVYVSHFQPFPSQEYRSLRGQKIWEAGPGSGQLLNYLQSGFNVRRRYRHPESFLVNIGLDPLTMESTLSLFIARALGWLANKILMTLHQTRNFVLVAEQGQIP